MADAKGKGDAKGSAKAVITRKIGPLPLIAWVGIGSAVLFVVMRMRRGSSSSDEGTGAYTVTNPATGIAPPTFSNDQPSDAQTAPDFIPFAAAITDLANAIRSSIAGRNVGAEGEQSSASPGDAPIGSRTQTGQKTVLLSGSRVSILDVTRGTVDRLMPRAGDLAVEPAGGFKEPPLFQQISPTEVLDATVKASPGVVGTVNPDNRLLGYSDPTSGDLFPDFQPGRVAIWR